MVIEKQGLQHRQLDVFVTARVSRDEHLRLRCRPVIRHAADRRIDRRQLGRREIGRVIERRQSSGTRLHLSADKRAQRVVGGHVGSVNLRQIEVRADRVDLLRRIAGTRAGRGVRLRSIEVERRVVRSTDRIAQRHGNVVGRSVALRQIHVVVHELTEAVNEIGQRLLVDRGNVLRGIRGVSLVVHDVGNQPRAGVVRKRGSAVAVRILSWSQADEIVSGRSPRRILDVVTSAANWLDGGGREDGACRKQLALFQDVGGLEREFLQQTTDGSSRDRFTIAMHGKFPFLKTARSVQIRNRPPSRRPFDERAQGAHRRCSGRLRRAKARIKMAREIGRRRVARGWRRIEGLDRNPGKSERNASPRKLRTNASRRRRPARRKNAGINDDRLCAIPFARKSPLHKSGLTNRLTAGCRDA